jgi:hypothetical protein
MAGGTPRLSVRANASRHRNLFARNRGAALRPQRGDNAGRATAPVVTGQHCGRDLEGVHQAITSTPIAAC